MESSRILKRTLRSSSFPGFALMLILFGINSLITSGFSQLTSMVSLLNLMVPLICLSIGLGVVVIGGGLDLSLGAIVSLVNVIFVSLSVRGTALWMSIFLALGAALAIGAINGFVIGFLRVNALLTTFATQSVASGLALWIMPLPSGKSDVSFVDWYSKGAILGIPVCLAIILIMMIIWGIVKLTPFSSRLLAVGRDEQRAYVSGINTRIVLFVSYLVAAFCAWIGGVAFTANISAGDPLAGLSITLNAVAAVVVGGLSLSGGKGGIWGGVFGAVFLSLITQTVLGANVSPFYQDLTSALIILIGIVGMNVLQQLTEARTRENR